MRITASNKKISKKQIYKLIKKANREIELEGPGHIKTGAHKTSKKDKQQRQSNTIRPEDID